ncbi:hypothetical protein BIY24_01950 [Halobacteriovorax marinus]|uniref:Glycosyltransferase n=1 Tax=Halobacteriovorax marinus (strain ATCC BAA-682 / DSM 15412 / SJ) TaxID=862908 RepID=E1X3X3_HALMS|nr:hypothetical protein [Halobacteriovorax marinus]ATH06744.1 hypothetical protein BIY24_01950 [Halobacteriovorax marinus]CBW25313.1 hypothetical protein BMS_0396 [Halobacteriovorax marinus SJ]
MTKLISGITFIKNGLTLGYPIKESIESIDSLCDEIIINVGFDNPELTEDDGTWDYLTTHFKGEKYIFLKSYWDPAMTSKGLILSQQTNIALERASGKYCQYIQGDECLHENDLETIRKEVEKMESDHSYNGLVFNYIHFYGNVNVQKQTKKTYRRELRLIRNGLGIKSWLDAQGFRNKDDSKVLCKQINATVYHYGWARAEQVMQAKTRAFEKLYHGDKKKDESFNYERVWGLRPFKGEHPKVMNNWIEANKNDLDILSLPYKFNVKDIRLMLSDRFEYLTGIRLGEFKNFKLKN